MKNALIIMPNFYAYADSIRQGFNDKGYDVDLFYEQPSVISYLTMRRIEHFFKSRLVYHFFLHSLFRKIKKTGKKYDLFLVIRGNILNESFIEKINKNLLNTNAIKIYYTWDSFENLDHKGNLGTLFDKKYSFDSKDAKRDNGWTLLPLFYTKSFDADRITQNKGYEYDLSCIAGFNETRYEILSKIKRQNPSLNIKVCLYISRDLFDVKLQINPLYKELNADWIIFEYLSSKEVADINLKSKAILDITNDVQSGLSMRTIESIGLRRKLITNNSCIMEYNINNNVLLIDNENMNISQEWLNSEFKLDENIRKDYSLSGWIDKLMS